MRRFLVVAILVLNPLVSNLHHQKIMKLLPDIDIELDHFTNPELERLAVWLTNFLVLSANEIFESAPPSLTSEEAIALSSLSPSDRAWALARLWEQHYQRWLQSV